MNLLTDVLKLAERATPAPAAGGSDLERLPPPGEPRTARRRTFAPRMLPRRSGIGRVAGIAGVHLVVVVVAAVGGGHVSWNAGFVRPAAAESSPGAADGPAPAPEPAAATVRPDSAAGIVISRQIRADHVAASLQRAYEALLAGDGESAERMYRTVLVHEPENRDARLGLAAVATRDGRRDQAAEHYARILAAHPADTVARAALIAIDDRGPTPAQSRLKALLVSEPRGAHLHFALGSLYAAQSRWPEAQNSFFNACRFDRGNADYAYNLAVSLDHLSQPRSALGRYRKALALSRSRPSSFDAVAVRRRIRELDTPAQVGSTTVGPVQEAAAAAPAERIR